jgi:predicted permease
MNTFELISKFLPVFLLFLLGYIFRRTGFLSPNTASELKKLAANITLPALLFRAFASMELGPGELRLALFMFSLCVVLLAGSLIFMRLIGRGGDIRAYMIGGFEAGMLGYSLFLAVFGNDALPVFASVDLGQLLFVLLVLISLLLGRSSSVKKEIYNTAKHVVRNIVTSPFVWAVVSGLILGWIGRSFDVPTEPFIPITGFLEILGNLTVPLIALAIGYELSFGRELMGRALIFVVIRKTLMLGTALMLMLMRFLPVDNALTRNAFITMLLLPPPYVVTLIAKDEEQGLVSGILSLSTIVSIPAFALAILIMGAV